MSLPLFFISTTIEDFANNDKSHQLAARSRSLDRPDIAMPSNQQPTFTIISPSFNQGEFIDATIQSILDQDYPELEHIVVDGGSTDTTLDSLRAREAEYNLIWISEPDNGIYDALNKAIALAKGEWIGWLNCDDLYPKGLLDRAAKLIHKNPSLDILCGDAEVFSDTGTGSIKTIYRTLHYRGERFVANKDNLKITHLNACFFKSSLLSRTGPFDSSYRIIGDRDYMLRLMHSRPRSAHLESVSCLYRAHSGSITMADIEASSSRPVHAIESPQTGEMIKLTEGYINDNSTPREIRLWSRKTLARLRGGLAAKYLLSAQVKSFFSQISKCFSADSRCIIYFTRAAGHRLRCFAVRLFKR